MQLILEVALLTLSFVAVLLSLIGVPGNAFPLLIALGYWMLEGGPRFSGTIVLVFLALFLVGEAVEQLAATVGAKRYGGSKSGMVGAFLGSIIGAIVGSMVLPLIGTVLFVFVGCFLFTLAFEAYFSGQALGAGARAGWGAVVGKAFGLAFKYAVGFALLGLLAWRFWFVPAAPLGAPSTQHTAQMVLSRASFPPSHGPVPSTERGVHFIDRLALSTDEGIVLHVAHAALDLALLFRTPRGRRIHAKTIVPRQLAVTALEFGRPWQTPPAPRPP